MALSGSSSPQTLSWFCDRSHCPSSASNWNKKTRRLASAGLLRTSAVSSCNASSGRPSLSLLSGVMLSLDAGAPSAMRRRAREGRRHPNPTIPGADGQTPLAAPRKIRVQSATAFSPLPLDRRIAVPAKPGQSPAQLAATSSTLYPTVPADATTPLSFCAKYSTSNLAKLIEMFSVSMSSPPDPPVE